jgi:4,5-dihydroxyphthalate decarboxylase
MHTASSPHTTAWLFAATSTAQIPGVAFNLYAAFLQAKEHAAEQLSERVPSDIMFGAEYMARTRRILGADPFPYGVTANQAMLDTMLDYSTGQGLTRRRLDIESLFSPSTLDL